MDQTRGDLGLLLSNLTEEQRYEKAIRHMNDAIEARPIDHRLELSGSALFRFCYRLNTLNAYNVVMQALSWVLLIITFWEPYTRFHKDFDQTRLRSLLAVEWFVLTLFSLDVLVEAVKQFSIIRNIPHRRQSWVFFAKWLIIGALVVDLAIQEGSFPGLSFRFGRFLRPVLPFYYSTFYQKILKSILQSAQEMLILILFFVGILWAFSFLCTQLFNFDDYVPDDRFTDFRDFGYMAILFYSLTGYDGYPTLVESAARYHRCYLLIFVVEMFFFLVFFMIIPTSLIFFAFKTHMSRLIIDEDLEQKENLLIAFCCLTDSETLPYERFHDIMWNIYKKDKNYKYRISELFSHIKDPNGNKRVVTVNEFMSIVSTIEKFPRFEPPVLPHLEWVFQARKVVNKKVFLNLFVSKYLETIMVAVVLVDLVLIFVRAPDSLIVVLQALYLLELVLKVGSLGLDEYFFNDWNNLDFILIISEWVFTAALLNGSPGLGPVRNAVRLFRTLRVAKLVKLLREYNLFRAFSQYVIILEIIWRVVSRIMIQFGIVMKLASILFFVFYFYSILGMETFSALSSENVDQYYPDFNKYLHRGLAGYSIIFFQVLVQSGWIFHLYNLQILFGSFAAPVLYFFSLHFIVVLLVISICKGCAWEIYRAVDMEILFLEAKYDIKLETGNQVKNFSFKELDQQVKEQRLLPSEHYAEYEVLLGQEKMKEKLGDKGNNCCLQITLFEGRSSHRHSKSEEDQFFESCSLKWYMRRKVRGEEVRSCESVEKYIRLIIEEEFEEVTKDQSSETIGADYILKRNMLKDINPELLAIYEVNNLMEVFKGEFEQLHEVDIGPILNYQFNTLSLLRSLLRQNSVSNDTFFEILNRVEANINRVLINEGSLFKIFFEYEIDPKFLYQFCVRSLQGEVFVAPLTKRFWVNGAPGKAFELVQDVFNVPDEARNSKIMPNYILAGVMNKLYSSILSMACLIDDSNGLPTFLESDPNRHLYNMYMSTISNQEQTRINIRFIMLQRLGARMLPLQYPLQLKVAQRNKAEGTDIELEQLNKEHVELEDKIGREGLPERYLPQFIHSLRDIFITYKANLFKRINSKFNQRYDKANATDLDD